jgi:hypothetical protein
MWLTDEEQKALLDTTGKITGRINKAVQAALQAAIKAGLVTTSQDVERVYRLAEHFDQRQEKFIKAQLRSEAARASTLKSNLED